MLVDLIKDIAEWPAIWLGKLVYKREGVNFRYMNFINYLNGKKTLIGTVLFFLAVEAQRHGLVNTALLSQIDNDAQLVGGVVGIIGLLHKGVKFVQSKQPTGV